MTQKKKKNNYNIIIPWVILHLIMITPQIIIFVLISSASTNTPEPSLLGTIKSIPYTLIASHPIIVPLIYAIYKRSTNKFMLVITLCIMFIVMDSIAPIFGGYSLIDSFFNMI